MVLTDQDYYNCYYGGSLIVDDAQYLWPDISGVTDGRAIIRRMARAAYPNFIRKIINIYSDYVFFSEPKIDGVLPPEIDVKTLGPEILRHILIAGKAVILILRSGVKVYRIIDCKFDSNYNLIEIIGDAGTKICINNDAGQLYAELYMSDKTSTREDIIAEQIIYVKLNELGQSFIADAALINLQIYNLQCILDDLCQHAGTFNSTGPDIDSDLKYLSPFTHVPSEPGMSLQFVSPPVEGIDKIRVEIDRRIAIMAAIVGLSQEFAEDISIESGEAKKWRMLDTNAAVLSIAHVIAGTINQIIKINAMINSTSVATVTIDPLLNPTGDLDRIRKLTEYLDKIYIDDLARAAQVELTKIVFSELPEIERQRLVEIAQNQGGLSATQNPALTLQV